MPAGTAANRGPGAMPADRPSRPKHANTTTITLPNGTTYTTGPDNDLVLANQG
jgi:hypothetical protein